MNLINTELKNNKGKRNNKRIRKLGYIPSIISIKNNNSIAIKIKYNFFKTFIDNNKNTKFLSLIINSEKINVKIKKIQYHPFKNKILHIDFIKIID